MLNLRYHLPPHWIQYLQKHAGLATAAALDVKQLEQSQENIPQLRSLEQDFKSLDVWLQSQATGVLEYMHFNQKVHGNPQLILENTQTIIVGLFPYASGLLTRTHPHRPELDQAKASAKRFSTNVSSKVAQYALSEDYHKQIKRRLDAFCKRFLPLGTTRVIVDTAPFLERAHARLAGLGFIGKNTMLIAPGWGSGFFIASVFVTLSPEELLFKKNVAPVLWDKLSCGDCRKCLDACPTNALHTSYSLDPKKCLSYLTIENRELIPNEFIPAMKDTWYGCDICNQVCPYNLKTFGLDPSNALGWDLLGARQVTALEVAKMDIQKYEKWFGGTALTRAKYPGLVRNALCHLVAQGSSEITDILESRVNDSNPLIQKTVWQLKAFLGISS